LNNEFKAYSLGLAVNYLTYPVLNLGCSINSLILFLEGKLFGLTSIFTDYYNINQFNLQNLSLHFFIGMSMFNRIDSEDLFYSLIRFLQSFVSLDYLHVLSLHLGRISCVEMGLMSVFANIDYFYFRKVSLYYLCGVDLEFFNFSSNYCIFQGFFANNLYSQVNLILPACIYTEGEMSFINLEGRYRKTIHAIVISSEVLLD